MSVRIPLYAKWAIGFTAHLTALVVVSALLIAGHFRDPLARLAFHQSRDRLESAVRVLLAEMETLPPDAWEGPLHRFESHYNLPLALLNADAEPLAGSLTEIPDAVAERLRRPPLSFINALHAVPPPPAAAVDGTPISVVSPISPPPRRFFFWVERTGDPPRYWLITRVRVNALGDESSRLYLVLSPRRLFGGLFMDPRPLILGAVALVAVSLLLWTPFVLGITRAIGMLTRAGRRIAEGRFDTRVAARRRDELGELARTMNEMAVRLEAMTSDQKRFLAGAAHELCSPLARLQVALGVLEQRTVGGDRTYVESALANAKTMSDLVNELLSFSKAAFGRSAAECRVTSLAEPARAAVEREAPRRVVCFEMPTETKVWADPALLDRALGNILRNAARYAPEGDIVIRAERVGDEVVISVEDEGPGVPEESLPRLFEPFYRVEPSRDRAAGGQGLGLTLVKAAVEAMGGAVWAERRVPCGLAIRLRLRAA